MASCILHQNADQTISIIDIPRSIEITQGFPNSTRRLLSSEPLKKPYPSTEPKSQKARERLGEISLNDLLLSKHLQFALDEVKSGYDEEWCLSRAVLSQDAKVTCKKRKRKDLDENDEKELNEEGPKDSGNQNTRDEVIHLTTGFKGEILYQNSSNKPLIFSTDSNETRGILPPRSTILCGSIAETRDIFISSAPKFDLVILDPPWPNRSARRKKSYGISYGINEIRELLTSVPVKSHLAEDGTVGVWITNREAFRDLLLQPGELFDEWGVSMVEEWIWLKTTVTGEPICSLDSVWRKPYEILLVGRRGVQHSEVAKRRVIIGVPDLHSRKPNLKPFFDQIIRKDGCEALEVFARNMTAGWWAWGNEVLKFQMDDSWIDGEDN